MATLQNSINSLGEFRLIKKLTSILPSLPQSRWHVGIGDDCSVYQLKKNYYQLSTTDLLLENIHFKREWLSEEDLGWKSLAVNLSDIAAMGGLPQQALIGLAVPQHTPLKKLEDFYRGIAKCSRAFHCPVVGGDTNVSGHEWVISIAAIGWTPRSPLLRSGAAPGDSLWVSGPLGLAGSAWRALKKKKPRICSKKALLAWRRPQPRLLLGQYLIETGMVTSMIDLSDGLAGDMRHISELSSVGFEVELYKIPGYKQAVKHAKVLRMTVEEILLCGGEDYELLFTVANESEEKFKNWVKNNQLPFSKIGQATLEKQIVYTREGRPLNIKLKAYEHFS